MVVAHMQGFQVLDKYREGTIPLSQINDQCHV